MTSRKTIIAVIALGLVLVGSVRWKLRADDKAQPNHAESKRSARTERATDEPQPASTAAIAMAVASTLPVFNPATQMRPERTMYTPCTSRSVSTCAGVMPV